MRGAARSGTPVTKPFKVLARGELIRTRIIRAMSEPHNRPHGRIRVVTFDLDDTLWAVGPVIAQAERLMWAWLGTHCPQMTARYDRDGLLPMRAAVLAREPGLVHDIGRLRMAILDAALAASGYGRADAERLAAGAFEVFMEERHRVAYFEHAETVLERLGRRFALGVVSNGNADVARLPIGRHFAFAISAAAVGASKPAPDVFRAALAAAGCRPEEMVHVGDHHDHDVAGAARLGIHTVWVNYHGDPFPGPERPSAEVGSLADLPAVLDRIATGRG